MTHSDDLKTAAQDFMPHDTVLNAGVFGVPDNYLTITAFGAAAGAAADAIPPSPASPLLDTATNLAALHAARETNAAAQGLTPRLLLAVTPTTIHILDWDGSHVHRELLSFTRATTTVNVTKFGASRRLHLHDDATDTTLDVTGSTGFLSSEATADKLVMEILAGGH